MEYLLYGLERNETRDYMEQLLLVTLGRNKIDTIKQYAIDKLVKTNVIILNIYNQFKINL